MARVPTSSADKTLLIPSVPWQIHSPCLIRQILFPLLGEEAVSVSRSRHRSCCALSAPSKVSEEFSPNIFQILLKTAMKGKGKKKGDDSEERNKGKPLIQDSNPEFSLNAVGIELVLDCGPELEPGSPRMVQGKDGMGSAQGTELHSAPALGFLRFAGEIELPSFFYFMPSSKAMHR